MKAYAKNWLFNLGTVNSCGFYAGNCPSILLAPSITKHNYFFFSLFFQTKVAIRCSLKSAIDLQSPSSYFWSAKCGNFHYDSEGLTCSMWVPGCLLRGWIFPEKDSSCWHTISTTCSVNPFPVKTRNSMQPMINQYSALWPWPHIL